MKHFYLFMIGAMLSSMSQAQAPLNATDLNTTIGTSFQLVTVPSDFTGSPGTNQVWDFSDFFPQATENAVTFEYGSTGSESNFPEANAVWSFAFDSYFNFYRIDENEYSFHGTFEEGGVNLVYSNPSTYCEFPLEMESTFVDTFAFNIDLQGITDDATGVYDAEVDGHGTLQLPWGEIADVYRVKGSVNQEEVLINGNDTIYAFYEGEFTSFFAPGYPGPLVQVRAGVASIPAQDIEQVQISTVYLRNFEFLGVDDTEVVEGLEIFPNPSNGQFTLRFENREAQNISLEVLDIQGRVVYSESPIGSGFGSVRHEFDLGNVHAGYYLLRLSDGEKFEARKIEVVR